MARYLKLNASVQEAFEPMHFRVWCFQPCDITQNLPLDQYIRPWSPREITYHSKQLNDGPSRAMISAYAGFFAGALGKARPKF